MDLEEQFKSKGPWVTRFDVDGVSYGGSFDAMNDVRVDQFFQSFGVVKSILELGSLEGGHSLALARNSDVESVTALEARDSNIERATFIKEILNDKKVRFLQADVESSDLTAMGTFDAVFCSGILYHLPEPWKLVEMCRKVSPRIFIWTQYACEDEATKRSNGHRGKWWKEGGWKDPLSGVSKWSFWLSMGSLVGVLTRNGYDRITIIENNPEHPHGCAVTLAAESTK